MSAPVVSPPVPPGPRQTRQKVCLTVLGILLILAGLVVAVFLRRIPLPLRLMIGLGDVIAGSTLLVLVRQKFRT